MAHVTLVAPMTARLLIALILSVSAAFAQPAPAIFSQIDRVVATLSEITGWPVKKKVPSEILTKEKFRQYLEQHTQDKSSQREIHAEEIALKMFGFVPQDFDLASETVDLLGEQAAAFYDYKKKRLFILDSTHEGEDQLQALVHELAHALADQQHPLGKYLNHGSPDNDEATAREAVMEGQATWLTWAYESKRVGGPPEVPLRLLDQLTAEDEASPDFPVLKAAPLYVRESLLFPYNSGARFQDAVFRKLGRAAFDSVFDRGPASTQQILHIEDYFNNKKPTMPDLPSLELIVSKPSHDFNVLIDGTLGEYDHQVLLRQYVDEKEGKRAADHWRGSVFRLYEHKKEKYPVLAYASEWDSAESAHLYFQLYQRVLKGKWKKMTVVSRSEDEIAGTGDSGRFRLRISGNTVQCLEGLK